MGAIAGWFKERVPVSGNQLKEITNEPVPNPLKHWWWCLGGTPAYLFGVQVRLAFCDATHLGRDGA